MARQQVLPYLVVEDLEDGDVVVEEALLGHYTFTQEASFGRYHKKPLLGVMLNFVHQQERTLLSEGGPSVD